MEQNNEYKCPLCFTLDHDSDAICYQCHTLLNQKQFWVCEYCHVVKRIEGLICCFCCDTQENELDE